MKKFFIFLFISLLLPFYAHSADLATLSQPQLAELIKNNSGKVILLNFFATWCPPCKVEVPELVKLHEAYPPESLLIIGLSVDEEKDPVPDFLKQTGVNYPVYMAGKDITNAYEINSVPHNAFYAPDGKLIISEPGLADIDILKEIVSGMLKHSPK